MLEALKVDEMSIKKCISRRKRGQITRIGPFCRTETETFAILSIYKGKIIKKCSLLEAFSHLNPLETILSVSSPFNYRGSYISGNTKEIL